MNGMGIAVRRKYRRGLEACGYECSELLKEQIRDSKLDRKTAADLVYVKAGLENIESVHKLISLFDLAERNGVPIDGLISGAVHFGVLDPKGGERLK